MAEGRSDEVADRLVPIGERGHDDGVLAAGLGQEVEIRPPPQEQTGGLDGAGQDDGADPRVGHERLADLVVGARQELEDALRDASLPEAAGEPPADQHRLGRGLEDDGVARG